jgi:hypothetical protein
MTQADAERIEKLVTEIRQQALSILVNLQARREKVAPTVFNQALAVAVGALIKRDSFDAFFDEMLEWSDVGDELRADDEAYTAALRDARFHESFRLGEKATYLPPCSLPRGRRRR